MKIKSVYIIDDDSITVFGLRKLLGKLSKNFAISEFSNGKAALEAIKKLRRENKSMPEVIFLDINMPIMDGWSFLDEFLRLPNTSSVTIKIITSSIDIRDRKKWESYVSKTHHQIDFITKPIYELDLRDMLDMYMAS